MEKKFVNIKEVAKITGYCEEYVRLLIRTGKIKSSKPNGGRLFVSVDDLNDFMEGK